MMKMIKNAMLVVMLSALAGPVMVHAGESIDDFESYKKGEKVGGSFDSTPWMRFGNATNDNILVTTDSSKVIGGRKSAQYSLFWPNKFGAARYHYTESKDLTAHTKVSIKVKSMYAGTTTKVKLAISDGVATYHSKQDFQLTDEAQQLTFRILEGDVVLVDGKGSFDEVISKVKNIGVDFSSKEGQYLEDIIFDDFELMD